MADDTYEAPEHGWTCFHCGEHFPSGTLADQRRARDHFGADPGALAACQIKAGEERGLLMKLRRLELANERYRTEDSDKDREFHALRAQHVVALRRAEEEGYERGLRDGQACIAVPE